MESAVIARLLPHRYPFLLLDRVIELEPGKRAVGIKNVTINEPYFQGHFPGEPIVPGVLLVESLAQLTAIMYGTADFPADTNWENPDFTGVDFEDIASKVGYLAEIRNIKFRGLVRPGDQLRLQAVCKNSFNNLSLIMVSASVDNKCVVDGTITVSRKI
ncbi:MAG: 3-hydroxyacyl-ACP dehydratase FabZ [Clostridia bacterium]|nr:3-hydroxyacyl-ACP dehydratase FabZ [Clostridia bacterium]